MRDTPAVSLRHGEVKGGSTRGLVDAQPAVRHGATAKEGNVRDRSRKGGRREAARAAGKSVEIFQSCL